MINESRYILIAAAILTIASCGRDRPPQPAAQANPPANAPVAPQVESRDMTSGAVWIDRLERQDRLAGLRIEDVIAALGLKDGDVVADIGAGTGAFTIPFAAAVGPSGKVLAVDLWPELLAFIGEKSKAHGIDNIETVIAAPDDPRLPPDQVDLAFFHDVFHNIPDRQTYLELLASYLKTSGRIAIIEQEFDDPIAKRWDIPEDRITKDQVDEWMSNAGFHVDGEFDLFQGDNNPAGAGMPERWFVVYARTRTN